MVKFLSVEFFVEAFVDVGEFFFGFVEILFELVFLEAHGVELVLEDGL